MSGDDAAIWRQTFVFSYFWLSSPPSSPKRLSNLSPFPYLVFRSPQKTPASFSVDLRQIIRIPKKKSFLYLPEKRIFALLLPPSSRSHPEEIINGGWCEKNRQTKIQIFSFLSARWKKSAFPPKKYQLVFLLFFFVSVNARPCFPAGQKKSTFFKTFFFLFFRNLY